MKNTKQNLIDTTFNLLYKKGFCATSLTDILDIVQMTKGAMYYHFKSKNDLVLASMQYYLEKHLENDWVTPLSESENPIETLLIQMDTYRDYYSNKKHFLDVKHGAPLSNFILDMSTKDDLFFKYLKSIYERWHLSVEKALDKAKTLKQTKTNIDANEQALFIVSSILGVIGTAKATNDFSKLKSGFEVLKKYINTL